MEKVTSDAVRPPLCYYEDETDTNTPFTGVAVENVLLDVPEASVNSYQNANVWKKFKFKNTTVIDETNDNGRKVVSTTYTNLDGNIVGQPLKGIYIKKQIFSDGSSKITKVFIM